jgi:hypothetical protein
MTETLIAFVLLSVQLGCSGSKVRGKMFRKVACLKDLT